ncbi:hypothetical protein BU15DRAFT_47827 [Melanogaster broomeanus]|nr:hypothetical protein BU15DRAFT_47827 [Melanogaster broomeanus]
MHPFGGTPICPRCNKTVYAAEQIMGPGRKPCLACTTCNKRLDSLTLLEHDQEFQSKNCHVRNFGTRDLRHANLPHRDDLVPPPFPASPVRNTFPTGSGIPTTPARGPLTSNPTGTGTILRANSALPARYIRSLITPPTDLSTSDAHPDAGEHDTSEEDEVRGLVEGRISIESSLTDTERVGDIQLPRTVPLSPSKSTSGPKTAGRGDSLSIEQPTSPLKSSLTGFGSSLGGAGVGTTPLKQTPTGTRYGTALGFTGASPGKTWGLGGATPVCPRCGKNVYFAEQMKAVGKTWHKGCLRCTSCNVLLDSKRLNDKDGDPFCGRCYSKLHGPQGSGYALLGKAGG